MSKIPAAAAVLVAAIAKARAGVDYSPKTGATCPWCEAKNLPVRNTKPWDGPARVRFHVCVASACPLCQLGQSIKSVEVDAGASGGSGEGRACVGA